MLEIGDRVCVLFVPDNLGRGLPAEERAFVEGIVGLDVTVESVTADEVEVRAMDARTGILHFLWLPMAAVKLSSR